MIETSLLPSAQFFVKQDLFPPWRSRYKGLHGRGVPVLVGSVLRRDGPAPLAPHVDTSPHGSSLPGAAVP